MFSCVDQCDQKAVDHFDRTAGCACDPRCVLYGDCCQDMEIVCPEMFADASADYSFLKESKPICSGPQTSSIVLSKHAQTEYTAPPTTMSSSLSDFTLENPAVPIERFQSPGPRIPALFTEFDAVDLKLGVVYFQYESFFSWKIPLSRLGFVPKIYTYTCFASPKSALNRYSIAQVPKTCHLSETIDVSTQYHRPCLQEKRILCLCGDGISRTERYAESCSRPFNALPSSLNISCQIFNSDPAVGILEILIDSLIKVKVTPLASPGFKVGFEELAATEADAYDMASLTSATTQDTGFSFSNDNVSLIDGVTWGAKRSSTLGFTLGSGHGNLDINKRLMQKDVLYLLEINGTIQSRLRCFKLNKFPSHCQLEECVQGAILVNKPIPSLAVGDRSCILPVLVQGRVEKAVSEPQICFCMRLLAAFQNLKIWDITATDLNKDNQCTFHLKTVNTDSEYKNFLTKFTILFFLGHTIDQNLTPY